MRNSFGSFLEAKYQFNIQSRNSIPKYLSKRNENMSKQRFKCECLYNLLHSSQNVVCPCNGILIHTKEQSADTCYNMDKPQKYSVNFKKPDTEDDILHNSTYMNYPEKSCL